MSKIIFAKILLASCVLQFVVCTSYAQWTQLNSGTINWLRDIDCPTKNICYAVGNNGTVLKTTNGGNNWQLKNSGIPGAEAITSIYCFDTTRCFLTGSDIYKTIDGGDIWQTLSITNGATDIYFPTDSIGYATEGGGGRYYKSTDNGNSWTWLDVFIHSEINSAVYFVSKDIGFFGTYSNGVIKTVNGGSNWTFSLGTSCEIRDITFPTDSVGFAVGINGCAYRTLDQGGTWDTLTTGTNESLYSIFCIDEDTCYATGTVGTVIKTVNGGNTWTFDTVGVPTNILYAVSFPIPLVGYAVGTAGTIIKKDLSTGFEQLYFSIPQILIAPNPFSEKTIIYLTGKTNNKNIDFELYDLLGKKILTKSITQGSNTLQRNGMSPGIYIYNITDKTRILNTGKIVVY